MTTKDQKAMAKVIIVTILGLIALSLVPMMANYLF